MRMNRRMQMASGAFLVMLALPATAADAPTVQERLGHPASARLLVLHADDLGMSSAQRAALDSLLDDRNRQYDSLMAPVRPAMDSLGVLTRQRLRQLLTPEQQATYDQIQREREEARRREKRQ